MACGSASWRKFDTARQCWSRCFLTDANHQPDRLRNRSQVLPRWKMTSSSIRSSKNSRPASPGRYLSFGSVFAVERIQRLNGRVIARCATGRIGPFTGWPMKNRPGFVGFLLRRSIVRTGQLSVQQRALVHRAIRRRQRWRHMPPHAGDADIRAGDDGKDSVDAGTHGGIFIQRRVNRGAGAVGVRAGDADDTGAVSAGLRPPFWWWSMPAIRRRSPRASRCLADRHRPERYTFRPGDRNRRRG
ncbi:Uncharacterised protein [Salmonella enterica subsp. enterica]|nr:Uncharacterised protein [Salmonella enterica subsp. enterica]